jgi:uncharacterized membrane protein HdeD (DUF308 family)
MNVANTVLAVFLLVFGMNLVLGIVIPSFVIGALAIAAGILLLVERFRVRIDRR